MTELEIRDRATAARKTSDALLDHQAGNSSYDDFMKIVIEVASERDKTMLEAYKEFLENNRANALPNRSSGSLFTAIIDFDNLYTDDEITTDEEYDMAHGIWNEIMRGN